MVYQQWRRSPDVVRDDKVNSSEISPASTTSERRGRGFNEASRPRKTARGEPSASGEPLPASTLVNSTKGDGGQAGNRSSARTRVLSPSPSSKPSACSDDPARPAFPASASEPAGGIATAVDGDAAAGEVAGSANAARAGVAAAAAAVATVAAEDLGRDQGGASPAAVDAEDGCASRPTQLGLGSGTSIASAAEAEAPGWEKIALTGEVSGTPPAAPPVVAVVAAAAMVAATSERENGENPEGVLDKYFLEDGAVPSRTSPGVEGKGFHSTARRGVSGRDGDSSAGRGEGEGAFLAGTAQAALPEESVTGTEAECWLPRKDPFGGEEGGGVTMVAAAAAVVEVVGGEAKGGAGAHVVSKAMSLDSTQASTLVPVGGGGKEGAAMDGEVAAASASASAGAAASAAAAAVVEEEDADGYRGDAAYAGLLIAEHLELFFRQQVRFRLVFVSGKTSPACHGIRWREIRMTLRCLCFRKRAAFCWGRELPCGSWRKPVGNREASKMAQQALDLDARYI